jgi:DNA-binding response OmpR family regulator
MKLRVLVVEDSEPTREAVALYLSHGGYDVSIATSGAEALHVVATDRPDLIVLDIMLPGLSGLDVCRALRERTDVPIIVLTALSTEADTLRGLEAGADDYVTKPFSPRELTARVGTVLRRARPSHQVLVSGPIQLDRTAREVRRDREPIRTTPAEFRILEVLIGNPGRAWTRAELADRAFGLGHEALDRTIDAHIMNLRRKLETDRSRPAFIETVFGVGYRFTRGDAS